MDPVEIDAKLENMRKEVSGRLSSIQEQLGRMTEVMQHQVRLEERLVRFNDAMLRIGREVDDHEKRLRPIETSIALNKKTIGVVEHIFFLILAGGLGAAASWVFGAH